MKLGECSTASSLMVPLTVVLLVVRASLTPVKSPISVQLGSMAEIWAKNAALPLESSELWLEQLLLASKQFSGPTYEHISRIRLELSAFPLSNNDTKPGMLESTAP